MKEFSIKERIDYILQYKNMSMYQLAKKSGISMNTLYNMETRNTVPSVHTIEKICEGLEISLGEFFNLDERNLLLSKEEKLLIEKYRKMESDEKGRIMGYVDALLSD